MFYGSHSRKIILKWFRPGSRSLERVRTRSRSVAYRDDMSKSSVSRLFVSDASGSTMIFLVLSLSYRLTILYGQRPTYFKALSLERNRFSPGNNLSYKVNNSSDPLGTNAPINSFDWTVVIKYIRRRCGMRDIFQSSTNFHVLQEHGICGYFKSFVDQRPVDRVKANNVELRQLLISHKLINTQGEVFSAKV